MNMMNISRKEKDIIRLFNLESIFYVAKDVILAPSILAKSRHRNRPDLGRQFGRQNKRM